MHDNIDDLSSFSFQENAVVIQETLKLLVHWGYQIINIIIIRKKKYLIGFRYTPDVIQTFKEIYVNDTEFFNIHFTYFQIFLWKFDVELNSNATQETNQSNSLFGDGTSHFEKGELSSDFPEQYIFKFIFIFFYFYFIYFIL